MPEYKLDESFGFLVGRSSRLFNNYLNKRFQKNGFNVTTEQWSILVQLWSRNGQTQQEIVVDSFKDKATITRLINALEKRNLVVRVPAVTDKRSNIVYLTQRGKELQGQLMKITLEVLMESQKDIQLEDMITCKNVLRKVFSNLSE